MPKDKVLEIPDTATPADQSDNWQTAFVLKTDLRQKDVYTFESELRLLEKAAPTLQTVVSQSLQVMRSIGMTVDSSIESEHHLKAAIKAGWIANPVCEIAVMSPNGTAAWNTAGKQSTRYFFAGENVDEMQPGKVRWYGRQIQLTFQAAVEIPDPNS